MQHTIEMSGLFNVTKGPRGGAWLAAFAIDLEKVPAELILPLALHGLKQKIADAASGATTQDEAFAAMAKAGDAILAGDWTVRTAGAGAVPDDKIALVNLFGRAVGAKDKAKGKLFAAMPMAEKLAKAEANAGAFTSEQVAAEVAAIVRKRDERAAEKAANALLAQSVAIDIDF